MITTEHTWSNDRCIVCHTRKSWPGAKKPCVRLRPKKKGETKSNSVPPQQG